MSYEHNQGYYIKRAIKYVKIKEKIAKRKKRLSFDVDKAADDILKDLEETNEFIRKEELL